MVKKALPSLNNAPKIPIMNKNKATRRSIWSELPADLVDRILSFLPMRMAARNAVLARRYSKTWRRSRHLDFDVMFLRRLGSGLRYAKAVDRAIRVHRGDEIVSLSLCLDGEPPNRRAAVKRWVGAAAKKGVKHLSIDFLSCAPPQFVLPAVVVQVTTLESLSLKNCAIHRTMSALRQLKKLVLQRVYLHQVVAERILVRCELLESLEMLRCMGTWTIKIGGTRGRRLRTLKFGGCTGSVVVAGSAPSLRTLHYGGNVRKLILEGFVENVVDAVFSFGPIRGCPAGGVFSGKLEPMLRPCFSRVFVLTLASSFLEDSAAKVRGAKYKHFNVELTNLKELQLCMESPSFCTLFDIACFLFKCPALERLFIDFTNFEFEVGKFWECHLFPAMKAFDKNSFENLSFVKLNGFKFEKHEIYVVKFLLKKSPKLETMSLVHPKEGRVTNLDSDEILKLTRVFDTWKCSPSAKIRVSEIWGDNSYYPRHFRDWY